MSAKWSALLLAAALLATCCQARQTPVGDEDASQNGRALLQAPEPWVPASVLRDCGEFLKDTLTPPERSVVGAVFYAKGMENYTCVGDRWRVVGSRKDLYYAGTGEFAGFLYAEASDIENSRYVFTDPTNTTEWGTAVKDNQVTFNYEPLDPEVNRKWWRRALLRSSGIAANTMYVIKTDVKGGMPPDGTDCVSGQDTDLYVPMENTYTFYACPKPVGLPHTPKCDPPASAKEGLASGDFIKNWEGTANGTCAGDSLKLTYGPAAFFGSPATYWMDASADGPIWQVNKVIGEPLCDYLALAGAAPATCNGSATYTCLQCK